MNRRVLVLLIALGTLILSGIGLFILDLEFQTPNPAPEDNEEICVPAQCCHAHSCVLKNSAPDCSDVFCTMECRDGTMDCGAGHCDFVDGKCGVVWNE